MYKRQVQLSLPIVDSAGNPVIKYAKATYAFTEQNENNILNFEMNDILLLVEYINDDWYVGEVYQSEGQHGLVPMNYVKIIQWSSYPTASIYVFNSLCS